MYYSTYTKDSPQLASVLGFYGHPIPQEAGKSVQALDASVGVHRQIIVLILKVKRNTWNLLENIYTISSIDIEPSQLRSRMRNESNFLIS